MKYFKRILNILVILSSAFGVSYSLFSGGFSLQPLLFFTTLSNIFVLVMSSILLYFDLSKKELLKLIDLLNYLATAAITLTFLVFSIFLMPTYFRDGNTAYLVSIGNIVNHNLTPILMITYYIMYGKKVRYKDMLYTLIFPLIYFVFALMANPVFGIVFNSSGDLVPYFFLDHYTHGWFTLNNGFFGLGVFFWVIIIQGVVLGIASLLTFIKGLKKEEHPILSEQRT